MAEVLQCDECTRVGGDRNSPEVAGWFKLDIHNHQYETFDTRDLLPAHLCSAKCLISFVNRSPWPKGVR